MKSKKRFLSLFLALVMVVTVLPLNVFAAPAPITKVEITEGSDSLKAPAKETYTAVVKDDQDSEMQNEKVTWTVSGLDGVTIDQSGLLNVPDTVKDGAVTITATSETDNPVTATKVVNITKADPRVADIIVTGEDVLEASSTKGYSAVVKDQFGNPMSGQTITWSVTNYSGVTIDQNGKLTASDSAKSGDVVVTAKVGSVAGIKNVTIKAKPVVPTIKSVTVSPSSKTVKVGDSYTLPAKATVTYSDNTTKSLDVTWGSKPSTSTEKTVTVIGKVNVDGTEKTVYFTLKVERNESAPYVSSARLNGSYIEGKATPYSIVYFYRNGSNYSYASDTVNSSGYYRIYVGSINIYSNDYVVAKNSNGTSSRHYISNWNWSENNDPIYDRDKRVYPSSKTLNWSKDVVEGRLSSYRNTKVSVYDGSTYVGSGYTDSYGDFKISLNRKVDSVYDLKFYVNSSDKSKESRIYPWSVTTSSYSVRGYYHPYTTVKAYYDGYYIGSDKTDSDGYFTISSNRKIYNDKYLKFYSDDAKDATKAVVITSAKAGESKVTGVAADYATITVKDSNGNKLGTASADRNGKFTLYTTRTLKPGEKLTIVSSETGKSDYTTTYTVTGIKEGDLVRIAYIKGYPDGNFNPKWNMTRAEAAAMFGRLLNGSDNFGTSKVTKFSDANDQWYSQAINYVVEKNLISGYPDGTFKPNEKITRAEFAKMISGYVKAGYPGSSNFSDVKGHWASDAIEKVYGNKVVKGYPDGTFKPNQEITRAEAVTILNAVFGRVSSNTSIANASNLTSLKTFRDIRPSDWFYSDVIDASNAHKSYRTSASDNTEIWTSITN